MDFQHALTHACKDIQPPQTFELSSGGIHAALIVYFTLVLSCWLMTFQTHRNTQGFLLHPYQLFPDVINQLWPTVVAGYFHSFKTLKCCLQYTVSFCQIQFFSFLPTKEQGSKMTHKVSKCNSKMLLDWLLILAQHLTIPPKGGFKCVSSTEAYDGILASSFLQVVAINI